MRIRSTAFERRPSKIWRTWLFCRCTTTRSRVWPKGLSARCTASRLCKNTHVPVHRFARGSGSSLLHLPISHLAQNPFVCDCNVKWLADFLRSNPIETSGARCASPRRLANKRIAQIKSSKFRCSGQFPVNWRCLTLTQTQRSCDPPKRPQAQEKLQADCSFLSLYSYFFI